MMLRLCGTIVLSAIAARPVLGQSSGTAAHQVSMVCGDSRYEVVQSPLVARLTLKLDKHAGVVYQLVRAADSSTTWDIMIRRNHPAGDTQISARVNYQLFLSGLAVRYAFLTNVNTGATWQLVETDDKSLVWSPVP
jgi:hypothetical protein